MSVISLLPLLRSREKERAKTARSKTKVKQRLTDVLRSLHDTLTDRLDSSVVHLCAKKLGLSHKGEVVLGAPQEMNVLYDYTLHEHRPDGLNAIERFVKESPPVEGSDEALILNALLAAKFSVFEVTRIEPLLGVELRDIVRETTLFMVDYALSLTATTDMWCAGNYLALPEFNMFTGAFLPVDDAVVEEALHRRAKFAATAGGTLKDLTPQQQTELATTVIRMALRHGAGEMVGYV
jgi:hypothetical protein